MKVLNCEVYTNIPALHTKVTWLHYVEGKEKISPVNTVSLISPHTFLYLVGIASQEHGY